MPREMDFLESALFIDRHAGLLDEIQRIDNGGMFGEFTGDLAFPWGDGRAIYDQAMNGYVLVWRDASKRWHYIDLSDKPQLDGEFNNEPYVAPDSSFTQAILEELKLAVPRVESLLTTGLIFAVVVIVLGQRRQ